jgi:hypothetical protein
MEIFIAEGTFYGDHVTVGVFATERDAHAAIAELQVWRDEDQLLSFEGYSFTVRQAVLNTIAIELP